MMRWMGRFYLFLLVAGLAGARLGFAADPITEQFQKQWEATRNQITLIAEAVPEDKYDFRPTPEVRNFRELLQHFADENYFFMATAAGVERGKDRKQIEALKTRAELLAALKESYDWGAKILAGWNDQKAMEMVTFRGGQVPRLAVVIAHFKDNHEHYGNMVTYARLNGIVPPRTAARQQQR